MMQPTTNPDLSEKPEIQDVYYLESLEQLEAISDPIRYRMVIMMTNGACTGAQLARALHMSRARAHYHLKLLEKVGLVKLWAQDSSTGITEKYYLAVGRMLDYTRLILKGEENLPAHNEALQSFQAVSKFLVTLLDVSRDSILTSESKEKLLSGFYYDFSSVLTPQQVEIVRAKLKQVKNEIITMTRENELRAAHEPVEVVKFRTTLFLTLLSEVFSEGPDTEKPTAP